MSAPLRWLPLALLFVLIQSHAQAATEESIRGVLEKTTKAGASAQITDVLGEVYYIVKTDEADKAVADFVGKNIRVVIIGTAEQREGDAAWFFNLKSVKKHEPKSAEAKPASDPKSKENAEK